MKIYLKKISEATVRPYNIYRYVCVFMACTIMSCAKYLDVIPDNVATIDNAFALRTQAEKYLYTCYSYLPKNGNLGDDPAIVGGDELWSFDYRGLYFSIARGNQSVVGPVGDRWGQYYRAIRDCNIFLENIDRVPDISNYERARWISEVKFLKAYYHFYLIRMYGPIPIVRENLPIDATPEQVKVMRNPVDECFRYVVELLDESFENLPEKIDDPMLELGRITRPAAMALKAYVAVYAASPLFNGNTDQTTLHNPDGTSLFPSEYSVEKWQLAAEYCEEAIVAAHAAGHKLYYYQPSFQQYDLSDTTIYELSIRNAVTERWNEEIIWGNSQAPTDDFQRLITPFLNPVNLDIVSIRGELSPPLKIVEQFYSDKGVPIEEDKSYRYEARYQLRESTYEEKLHVKTGLSTAGLHFDREPRFYASIGFDNGVWYGQGNYNDKDYNNLYYIMAKFKQRNGLGKEGYGTVTGYYLKKMIHFQNVIGNTGDVYSINSYVWPMIRLSDLYLLYAEAKNEASGPSQEVFEYLDLVRKRAGLDGIEASWTQFSKNPGKFQNKDGLREIIQQERLIELCFEGQRFWDLRRWKRAADDLNEAIRGWDSGQENASNYYRPVILFNQTFGVKDYFWPIDESNIIVNRNLVQNIGW